MNPTHSSQHVQHTLRRISIKYQPLVTHTITFLAVVITLAMFLYGIFLLEAVAHTGALANAQRDSNRLEADVSTLEGTYLVETQALTPDRAKGLGLVTPQVVSSVTADNGSAFSFVGK